RLLFTRRARLPAPFAAAYNHIELGALDVKDAIKLVEQVMREHGWTPKATPGDAADEVKELVEAVHGHPRALVLLAGELAANGMKQTTADLTTLMADLERRHPGDRENSLYASLELSLRRLSPPAREQATALAVFYGGAHLNVLNYVLEIAPDDRETVQSLACELIDVGLGEDMGYGYLRLDPALPAYLLAQLDPVARQRLTARWVVGMVRLVKHLDTQQSKDAHQASQLTLLELPNLLALLDRLPSFEKDTEIILLIAGAIEQILSSLGRPFALARVIAIRDWAAEQLGGWNTAQFTADYLAIERLLEQHQLPTARERAKVLLQKALSYGEKAYPSADYNIALAYALMGDVFYAEGAVEPALAHLVQAQQCFKVLGSRGERMIAICINTQANCLLKSGRLDESALKYEEVIKFGTRIDDQRLVAVSKGNLGTIHLWLERYQESLEAFQEARDIFERLHDPANIATSWHQIGRVYESLEMYLQAERAYRQALLINTNQANDSGKANTLAQLGNLYIATGRLEEAVSFHRQAADLQTALGDLFAEGTSRNNLTHTLITLSRYNEARIEILRAIECFKPYMNASQSWKSLSILHDLERAVGNDDAACAARGQAMDAFLAYRRAGGENMQNRAMPQLCAAVRQAIAVGQQAQLLQRFNNLAREELPDSSRALLLHLQAILRGDHATDPAADPALDYDDAVELVLLLEELCVAP
ncbi:MAG: tetratricopeptide repeat protein, partial [Armatimonadota bacterium]